ncbi:Guanylate kinase 3 [Spatholobus suberectus]|nr:Guanylate kinase 3 [Spatholobus suberectus]
MAQLCNSLCLVDRKDYLFLEMVEHEKLLEYVLFVFVAAESEMALLERFMGQKTETAELLLMRIGTVREEMKHVKNVDYWW